MTLSDIERRDPTCPVLSVHLYTSVCPAASVSGCMVTVLVCLDSGMTGVPILVRTPVYFLGGRGAIVLKVPFNTGRATFVRIEVKISRLFVVNHHRRSAQVWHMFSRNFTVLPAHPHVHDSSAIGMNHTCLCLPSRSWYSFTDPGGIEG